MRCNMYFDLTIDQRKRILVQKLTKKNSLYNSLAIFNSFFYIFVEMLLLTNSGNTNEESS